MTEVLTSSPSSSSTTSSLTHNEEEEDVKERDKDRDQLSLLALLLTLFRKSFWVACKASKEDLCGMEIGWPTNVRHVAHVTFDRFNGFLGLPVEFEPEVPRRAPSASATVFGVSTESMQLSYDLRGNSVPTILLQMQQRLYAQGGLQAEGIFRINGENSQEEFVRNQLNRGVVPDGIDVHCLAGLIKAWFRELPTGVLDPLAPEQVMQCQSEEDCSALREDSTQTESALLDWAINLMADVVQHEHLNKMNAHNIAMVFAPNMTQMADPLTALMYAVQVMNFLKTLITKTLREREDCVIETTPLSRQGPSDENGHQGPSLPCIQDFVEENEESEKENDKEEKAFVLDEPELESSSDSNYTDNNISGEEYPSYYSNSTEEYDEGSSRKTTDNTQVKEKTCESKICQSSELNDNNSVGKLVVDEDGSFETTNETRNEDKTRENKIFQLSDLNDNNSLGKLVVQAMGVGEKSKGISNLSRINSRTERIEAWR